MCGPAMIEDLADDAVSVDALVADFNDALGSRLHALYRYGLRYKDVDGDEGGGRLLAVVDNVDLALLKLAGPIAVRARKAG